MVGSGSVAGLYGSVGYLYVPAGYVSGTMLSDTATFANTTLSGLGFTPGTYTYTWGSGATADSLVVTGVPEPDTWTLLGIGATSTGVLALRQRRGGSRLSTFL